MFYYQEKDDTAVIFGGNGFGEAGVDGVVEIPETIGGKRVAEIAPYAFTEGYGKIKTLMAAGPLLLADWEGKPLGEWKGSGAGGEGSGAGGEGSAGGEGGAGADSLGSSSDQSRGAPLVEITLPKGIGKIGNYAFYRCYDLKAFRCHGDIGDVGSGVFAGCTGLAQLDIRAEKGKRSCFKELISELRQELSVNYYEGDGRACLVFPEMYEESVENTPARMINREMHGCGHRYRYCFQDTAFLFDKYDALFPNVRATGQERTAARLVMGRLKHPLGLMEQYRREYEAYLRERMAQAARTALEDGDSGMLLWLGERYGDRKELLAALIEVGSRAGTDVLAFLLDLEHRRFPGGRRTFSI